LALAHLAVKAAQGELF